MNEQIGIAVAVITAAAVLNQAVGVVAAVWPWLALLTILILAGVSVRWRHKRTGSAGTIKKWGARSRKHDGVASRWAMLRTSSRWAIWVKAGTYRPSLGQLPIWQRLQVPTTEFATCVAKVGRIRIYSSCEDVTLRIGGPRKGKTSELGAHVLNAPGAVLITSTRTDLYDITHAARSARGPVYRFNPCGLGEGRYASTVTFNPLTGCENPITALVRGADLIAGKTLVTTKSEGDRKGWEDKAAAALALLMHAAALGNLTMLDVMRWAADPGEAVPEVRRLMNRGEPAWAQAVLQFLSTNDTTRSSITSSMAPALNWLLDPTAAASAVGTGIDVEQFLAEHGTLHMLSSEESHTGPLATAFTAHVAREARRLAALQPKGRLDPPLTMVLDEAVKIPLPLPAWTSDMGGAGITLHIAAQGRSQLRDRWGDNGAATIINNAATLLIYGGAKDSKDLAEYSGLTGERHEPNDRKHPGKGSRAIPVLSPAQISRLPKHHVLIIRDGMPPALGQTETWKQLTKRAANAVQRATQPVPVVAPPVATPAPAPVQHVAPVVDIDSARKAPVA